MVLAYTDLKSGDVLKINPGALEIKVLKAEGKNLELQTPEGMKRIYGGENFCITNGIYLHNYGSRKGGHLNHVRLDFKKRNLTYICERYRNGAVKRILSVPCTKTTVWQEQSLLGEIF